MTVLTDEEKIAETEAKNEEGKKDQEVLYPKDEKTEEEKAADKAKEDEGKTDEEIAAEKKVADDKAIADKAAADKATEEAKKTEVADLVKAEDLKFPEGVAVNEEIRDELLSIVNDKDMKPADRAQALVNLQQKLYAVQAEAHQGQIAQWEKDVAGDKEIIGDTGDKMDENLATAKKGMQALEVEGLEKLFEDTGLGSHPLIVKAFLKVGKAVSEDTFLTGPKGGSAEVKTAAQKLYPDNVPK